jgi:hypothetical protein
VELCYHNMDVGCEESGSSAVRRQSNVDLDLPIFFIDMNSNLKKRNECLRFDRRKNARETICSLGVSDVVWLSIGLRFQQGTSIDVLLPRI